MGLINEKREEIIPTIYEEIDYDYRKVYIVKLKGKYGVFDAKGKELMAPQYDEIKYVDNDILRVREGDRVAFFIEKKKLFLSTMQMK